MPHEEERAIERVVENWFTAWQRGDADLAVRDYAEDADWTNVFGVRCRSRAELRATLTDIFSQPSVMAGSDIIVGHEMRFLGPDTAVSRTAIERRGQRTSSGTPLGLRRTTHLRVLVRVEGEWRIVSHLISDARDSVSS